MLEIINNLAPFFFFFYRRISVREYARIMKISPPTASKLLKSYSSSGLLIKQEELRHLFFYAHKDSKDFIDLSRIYWRKMLEKLILNLKNKLAEPAIILFGSLAKAEAKQDSDIDIAVLSAEKIDVMQYRNLFKRNISLHWFRSLKDIENENLMLNIINGYILYGRLK